MLTHDQADEAIVALGKFLRAAPEAE